MSRDSCIPLVDTRDRPETHIRRQNYLCMVDDCPIRSRMVMGPISSWKHPEHGYSRPVWCVRCSAKAALHVNLDATGRINGVVGPPFHKPPSQRKRR